MYVHSSFAVNQLYDNVTDIELLIISVSPSTHSRKVFCALFYRPPSSSIDCLSNRLCMLNPYVFNNFVLLGDFNVNIFNTDSYLYSLLSLHLILLKLCKQVTHISSSGNHSLIDLVFVSNISLLNECSVLPPLGNSDHCGLQLKLRSNNPIGKQTVKHTLWNYARGDFMKANRMIHLSDWNLLLTSDINTTLMNWQNHFLSIMDKCIPKITRSPRYRLPWLCKRIIRWIKSLYKYWRRYGGSDLHRKYKIIRNKVISMLRAAKRYFFRNINMTNSKLFWKTVHHLTRNSSTIPALTHEQGTAFSNYEKADTLSTFFKNCFNSSVPPLSFADRDTFTCNGIHVCPDDFLCTTEEVKHFLETLDVSKSTGPDGISARMLKSVACSIAPSVTRLMNNVVPIPKSTDKSNPHNYRPISLLPILSNF